MRLAVQKQFAGRALVNIVLKINCLLGYLKFMPNESKTVRFLKMKTEIDIDFNVPVELNNVDL